MQWKNRRGGWTGERGTARWVAVVLMALTVANGPACGPDFPNMMLVGGDKPLLTTPSVRFHREMDRALARLRIATPSLTYHSPTNSLADLTRQSDVSDLRSALRERGDTPEEIERLVAAYSDARWKLLHFGETRNAEPACCLEEGEERPKPAPPLPDVRMPAGLPKEFADYFHGALAWHQGHTNMARTHWGRLLERPAVERRFKSTWAAFMLARSWEREKPERAIAGYEQVRALTRERFVDTLGLAAASIGWQARAHLAAKEWEQAIELYLQQLALGDGTAYESLHTAAARALAAEPEQLQVLARNPYCRSVIMADVISSERSPWSMVSPYQSWDVWLEAVEESNAMDVDLAEQLALANYQMGNFGLAQRWVNRSTNAPVSQWVQAKLFLRAGKVNQATGILGRLARSFPLVEATNAPNTRLLDNLYVYQSTGEDLTPGRQLLGELGALRLQRREYAQALDALLRAGFWVDAAYVAERVLTTDEFKSYVDGNWPEVMKDSDEDESLPTELKPSVQSRKIRYVLARRLARDARVAEARNYFPGEWLEKYDLFQQCLTAAYNREAPREQRVTNYYSAAFLIRSNGMEMIGTEVQPDFTCWDGNFEEGPKWEDRAEGISNSVTCASQDEIERARTHGAMPDQRWHYRQFAPGLRAEARILEFELRLEEVMKMPRNTDETAMAFYKLGKSAPSLDLADIAYKQLVRRCRKTELGDAADRQRWFPPFNENGHPIVTRKPKEPSEQAR